MLKLNAQQVAKSIFAQVGRKSDIVFKMPDAKFSLKDELFNKEKVSYMAQQIAGAFNEFSEKEFVDSTVSEFPKLELKQRIEWVAKQLQACLPNDYSEAVSILVQSLPEELDPNKTDNDFGDFIFAPYSAFVAHYGCTEQHLETSLEALHEMTRRFSVEDAIRYFINKFPEQTMKTLEVWMKDENYHVRRLVSEGTRPRLPWSQNLTIDYREFLPFLEQLHSDPTRYVTRSVANHLNDISKVDPDVVIKTLKTWQLLGKQENAEMEFITKHALRTLIKRGDLDALALLGYSPDPELTNLELKLASESVKLGSDLEFEIIIESIKDEKLLLDYMITFPKASGRKSLKFFKLRTLNAKGKREIHIKKKHKMRGNMTTFKIIEGQHVLALQLNGKIVAEVGFEVIE